MTTQAEWYERAAVIPGRSLTRSKAPGRMLPVGSGPMYGDSSSHGRVYADGVPYVDMLCALGALGRNGLGGRGGVHSLPLKLEIEAAEAVLRHVAPWASSVRFTKTGSEATHAAYRIAKAATKRKYVMVGDWAYHGWHEWCADEKFPWTDRFPHGFDFAEAFVGVSASNLAAVFIEPHRWEPVDIAWLKSVRAFCDRVGALLVFDSMIYGGRFALGGASEYFGVTPDLECFGKAFGDGEAVAFVVGREAMQTHGEIVSGTYSGDGTGLRSVIRSIDVYAHEPVIDTIWTRGRQLAEGLRALTSEGVHWEGNPPHQRLRFDDRDRALRFAAEMSARGVLWHPDVVNISYAHTESMIRAVLSAAVASMEALSCE